MYPDFHSVGWLTPSSHPTHSHIELRALCGMEESIGHYTSTDWRAHPRMGRPWEVRGFSVLRQVAEVQQVVLRRLGLR
jgi:hypothetical protein